MNYLDAVQWPAMAITVVAAWFVAANHKWKRNIGFWLFILSNVAWVVWGLHTNAYGLIVLQICLAAMNIRGAIKASADSGKASAERAESATQSGGGKPAVAAEA